MIFVSIVTKKKAATSLREYARRRGVSPESVSKAIAAGRLRDSVVLIGGAPKIADVELADREWEANTRPITASRRGTDDGEELPEGIPTFNVSRAVREFHAARREGALADVAEIERDEKREALVPVDEAREYIVGKFALVKQKLLAIPSRVVQRYPELGAQVATTLEELLREVLEELAADEDADDDVEGEEHGEAE